jgi:sulfur carrier protein ThiS
MDNINITLKLYGGLDKYIKDYNYKKGASLRFDSNETIIDILKKLGIPKHRITLIKVGDRIINLDYVVKNDDLIKIFSHIGGG